MDPSRAERVSPRDPTEEPPRAERASPRDATEEPPRAERTLALEVYVHFPWCLEKCPYCDFVSLKTERSAIEHLAYAELVLEELRHRAAKLRRIRLAPRLRSIFIGGGTPSLWAPPAMGRALAGIRAELDAASDVEITVECNPTSLDDAQLDGMLHAGVNRLSIGVQSLDDERLRFLGRKHDARLARQAVLSAVRSGARVSADLIHGVHGQSPEAAAKEAHALLDLGVGHLSSYSLTIEPRTRFGELARRQKLPLLDDALVAESVDAVSRATRSRGLSHYEISNHARPGQEARHNLAIWRGGDYLGLGCAAVGAVPTASGHVRYRNRITPSAYAAQVHEGLGAPESEEAIDAETRLRERIMLGLRLEEGVDLARAKEELGVDPWTSERRAALDRLVRRGLIERAGSVVRLPHGAFRYADGVARDLM